jgi:hypothetical protein
LAAATFGCKESSADFEARRPGRVTERAQGFGRRQKGLDIARFIATSPRE